MGEEKRTPNPEPEYLPESLFDFSEKPKMPVPEPKEMEPWPTFKKEEKKEHPLEDFREIQWWLQGTLQILQERQQRKYTMQIDYEALLRMKKKVGLWGKLHFLLSTAYRKQLKREAIQSFHQLCIKANEGFDEMAKAEGVIENPLGFAQILFMFDMGFFLTMDLYRDLQEYKTPEAEKLRQAYMPIYATLYVKRSACTDYLYDTKFMKKYYPGPRTGKRLTKQ